MATVIEFKLEDGSTVMIEGVDDTPQEQRKLVSRGGGEELVVKAEKTLQQAIRTAKSAAEVVLNSFKEMNAPDEINLEFGITMSAAAGVVLASAKTDAAFKLSLKWKKA
jgi:hypothetical protein